MMYTEKDLTEIRQQQKKRWVAIIIPCVAMLVALIMILVIRGQRAMEDRTAQIVVDVLSLGIGFLLIFGWGMLIQPLHCYEHLMAGLLSGRTHEFSDGTFNRMDEDVSLVDGVSYHALYVNALDEKNKPYERLFYFDAQKQLPALREGQKVRVVYHDKMIGEIEAIA